MPNLKVAIDASKAQHGADEAAAATQKIVKGAKEAVTATGSVTKALDDVGKKAKETKTSVDTLSTSVYRAENTLAGMCSELMTAEQRSSELAMATEKSTRYIRGWADITNYQKASLTEASLVYENMTNAINTSNEALKASTSRAKEAAAAEVGLAAATNQAAAAQSEASRVFSYGITNELVSRWDSFGSQVRKVANLLLGMSAGVAAVYAVKNVVGFVVEFEKSLAKLQGVVQGSAGDMDNLKSKARELGSSTIYNATETADAMLHLAQAGLSVKQTVDAIVPVLTLATAGVIGLDDSSNIVVNTLNQFAMAASQAGKIADVFVNTANETNTTVLQMGEALEYVGPVASAFGISLEEASAAIGVLSNRGIQASIAGTNLRGILATLASPTEKMKNIFDEMGVKVEEVDPALHSLTEIFTRFQQANITAAQATELFNKRNGAAALVMSYASQELDRLTQSNRENAGIAQKNADIIENSLWGSFKKLGAVIKDTFLAVGQGGLVGGLTKLTSAMSDVIKYMVDIRTPGESLSTTMKLVGETTSFVLRTLTGLLSLKLATYLWSLIPPLIATNGYVAVLNFSLSSIFKSNPLGWIVTGVSALYSVGKAVYNMMSESGDSVGDLNNGLANMKDVVDGLSESFNRLSYAMKIKDTEGALSVTRQIVGHVKEAMYQADKQGKPIAISDLRNMVQSESGKKSIDDYIANETKTNPFYGGRNRDRTFLDTVATNKPQTQSVLNTLPEYKPLDLKPVFVDAASAAKILNIELLAQTVNIENLTTATKKLSDTEIERRQNEVIKSSSESLDEEFAAVGKTLAEKKAEAFVREQVQKAKKEEITLTDDQIEQIRSEAVYVFGAVAAWEEYLKQIEDSISADEKKATKTEELKKSLWEMVVQARAETEESKVLGVEKERLINRRKLEAMAVDTNIENLEEFIDLLNKEIDLQNQNKTSLIIENQIDKLSEQLYLLRLTEKEREVESAQLAALSAGYGNLVDDMDSYLFIIRAITEAIYDQKKANEDAERSKKAGESADDMLRRVKVEKSSIWLSDSDRENRRKGQSFASEIQTQYQLTNDEMERAIELSLKSTNGTNELGDAVNTAADKLRTFRIELKGLEVAKQLKAIADGVGNSFGNAFADIITGSKSAKDAIKSLYMEISRLVVQQMVAVPIAKAVSGGMGSLMGLGFASGAAFSQGSVVPMASGSIVSSPTYFPMSGGRTGLMGEAGPEAVMPLRRMANGRMGVESSGGGTTHVTMIINTPDADSFRRSESMITSKMKRVMRK